MRVEYGRIYAIVGHNGCGKTTLMDKLFLKHYNERIIYIKQNDCLINQLNIEENLKFTGYDFHNEDINEMLELEKVRKLYPSQISLGQRQMIAIVGALYSQQDLVIFDETFSGLNSKQLYFLLDLCKKSIYLQKRIILIITHQKQIIESCDKIIDFKYGTPDLELPDILPKPKKKVTVKNLFIYQEKNWLKHLIILIVLSACFLFISLTLYYRNITYQNMNKAVAKNMSTEAFILNNTDIYHPYYQQFDIYYRSIPVNQVNALTDIKGLNNLKAFIPFSIEPKRNNKEVYFDPMYITVDNKKIEKELILDQQYLINPYTTYSKIDDSLIYQTSHDDGIVLTEWFCEQMDIDMHQLENTQIEMNVSVPISQTDVNDALQTAVMNNDEIEWKNVEGRDIEYKEIKMSLFIKGILDKDSSFIIHDYCFGLLKQETMQAVFEQYNHNYQPNAYLAEIENLDQYQQIQQYVEAISPTLEFYCAYSLYQVSDVVSNFVKILSIICVVPTLIFLSITLYIIFIQRKLRLYDYEKLLMNGFDLKTCFEWIIKKYILDIILFIFLYIILFQFCNLYLNNIHYPLIQIQLYTFILPVILLCWIPIGVDIYALRKRYRHSMESS